MIDKNKQLDIMQHINNIYEILGYESIDGITDKLSISQILAKLKENHTDVWVGTEAQYNEGRGNGTIPDGVVCLITDDFVSPIDGTRAN